MPGDKSLSQRALILASLSEEESRLGGLLAGSDPKATARVLRALGARIPPLAEGGGEITLRGPGPGGFREPGGILDFENSGTGARLMLGVLAGQSFRTTVSGDSSLRSRPMGRIMRPLRSMGATLRELGERERLPLEVVGARLGALHYASPVASAQVKSALLLAGVVGRVEVRVSEPRPSRDHTERMLGALGISVASRHREGRWQIELRDVPSAIEPLDLDVPGDFSSAAFFVVLAMLGGVRGGLCIEHVGLNPTRTGLLGVLARMGGRLEVVGADEGPGSGPGAVGEPVGDLRLSPGALTATAVSESEVPAMIDEFPILAVAAARASGITRITGASELRVKESDRIRSLALNLRAVGVEAEELRDGLEIKGSGRPLRGRVRSHGDHRIAMAFGVLGALPGNRIDVEGASVVDVSFPGFWERLRDLSSARPRSRSGGRGAEGRDAVAGSGAFGASGGGLVVTIDGPAGAGKTTTAREVARRLGFRHLDSGGLYRAVTFALLAERIGPGAWGGLTSGELDGLGVGAESRGLGVEIYHHGRQLGGELRSAEVTAHVAEVASLPAVRQWLLGTQRELGGGGNLVADGRDMGTVVFPDADLKVFLVAGLEARARRRLLQVGRADPTPDEVLAEAERLRDRDRTDSGRDLSPLLRPDDAFDVDTTALSFEQQVSLILRRVKELTAL